MLLPVLNFPSYKIKTLSAPDEGQSAKVFDVIRKKYVALIPEEWVRQHIIHYLVDAKKVPKSLISVEKKLKVNELVRRTDVVIYNKSLKPVLLAECKAPQIEINQKVFDQAARYNLSLNVHYFVLTNGLQTICCTMDHEKQQYDFLEEIPEYDLMIS